VKFFHKWLSPVLYSFQGIVCLWDVGAGLFCLYKHHWVVAALNFGMGVFVGSVTYFTQKMRIRHEATMQHIRQGLEGLERRRAMPIFNSVEAETKARANLELVMKATGAKFHTDGQSVMVKIKKDEYFVQNGYVYKYNCGIVEDRTCIHFAPGPTIPAPEFIATAILLLKHDPSIFSRWKRQDNYYA
jgi:hypothetical protein